jgi:HEAT repeat protein
MLASRYYDDAFTPRLIAIANDTNSQTSVRAEAINALAANRTDAGVKTLKTLLKDPDWKIAAIAEQAIRHAYTAGAAARGKPLRPDDFDANLQYQ